MRFSVLVTMLIAGAGVVGCGSEDPATAPMLERVPVSALPDGKDGTLYQGNLLEELDLVLGRLEDAGVAVRRAWTPEWESSPCAFYALIPFVLVEVETPDPRMEGLDFSPVERPTGACFPFWILHRA